MRECYQLIMLIAFLVSVNNHYDNFECELTKSNCTKLVTEQQKRLMVLIDELC